MMLLRLKESTPLNYPNFYFPLEIDQISNWTSCSGELEIEINKNYNS